MFPKNPKTDPFHFALNPSLKCELPTEAINKSIPLAMSSSVHVITRSPPGYCPSVDKSLSLSRIARRAIGPHCTSISYYRTLSLTRFESLRCTPKKALVCRASSSDQRRNPEFPRQKKQGFSRSHNRNNEERDKFESLDESEPLSSRNGSTLSVPDTSKYQATAAAPGRREKEVVELFRKVQAQLREKAAMKEEKKTKPSQGKGKENETVDSLLKLLRKHSVEQGKRGHTSSGSGDFINHHHSEPYVRLNGDKSNNFSNFASPVKEGPKPLNASISGRPVSNFRKKSPVPLVKFQPVYNKESKMETEGHPDDDDVELEPEPEAGEPEVASLLSKMAILHEQESSDDENSDSEIEEETVEDTDLSSMKLVELRALAKARGMKGFSKIKKTELVQLLSRDST
ncbi:unnamed protein product [Rhodiola kirilowii]